MGLAYDRWMRDKTNYKVHIIIPDRYRNIFDLDHLMLLVQIEEQMSKKETEHEENKR